MIAPTPIFLTQSGVTKAMEQIGSRLDEIAKKMCEGGSVQLILTEDERISVLPGYEPPPVGALILAKFTYDHRRRESRGEAMQVCASFEKVFKGDYVRRLRAAIDERSAAEASLP